MSEAYPTRDGREGGRWSNPSLVEDVLHLAAIERAVVHVANGWVPKVPELDEKLLLASGLEDAMGRAMALRQCALTLAERDEFALVASPEWIAPLQELDTASHPDRVLDGLLGDVRVFLLARYGDLAQRLDPLYDARLAAVVRSAVDSLERVTPFVDGPGVRPAGGGSVAAALWFAWTERVSGKTPLDEVLWAPHDRVPMPGRPAGRPRVEPGALGHFRVGSRHEDRNVAGELNENLTAELCALELMCRSSYEHPDLPWADHLAIARHATDEARHAAIFRRLLAQRGFTEDALPQHGTNYEFAYQFPECEPGSKRELVWRLLLLCTVLEALAIDKIPPEIATLDWLGQRDIARALDYISTDELYHAENGLRLTRRLCAEHHLDPMVERERVHGRFFARQLEVRTRYFEADPDRAAREIAIMSAPDPDGVPFSSRTEFELRRRASFTEDECAQVERWGYNEGRRRPAESGADTA